MPEIDLTEPPEDRALLEDLGAALRAADPAPGHWQFAAEGCFTWRTVDAELAEMIFDSTAPETLALVRGPALAERIVVFEARGLRVEIELAAVPGTARFRVTGQLVPEGAGTVELRQPGGSVVAEADASGRFHADGIVAGPLSLRWSPPGEGRPVETAWLLV